MMTARLMLVVGSALLLVSCAGLAPRGADVGAGIASPSAAAVTASPADDAAGTDLVIKQSIPGSYPRLVVGSVPQGMTAHTTVAGGWYTVVYTDDLHTKELSLTDTFGVNPPPQGPNGLSDSRQFRGVRATYVVYDTTAPASKRYLLWDEPGTWPKSADGMPVNEFFLLGSGLTENEFLAAASSLRQVS